MILFRIGQEETILDLSGEGARRHGGRWNHPGVGIVYASENQALATLEYLVHLNPWAIPPRLKIASIAVPDRMRPVSVDASKLPAGWRDSPASSELAEIGAEWVASGRSLLLRVPSAIVPAECNVLINPSHPDMRLVKIAMIEDFPYDQRLLDMSRIPTKRPR